MITKIISWNFYFERKLSSVSASCYSTQSMERTRKLRTKANARGREITLKKISISNIERKSNILATSGSSCFYFDGSAHGNFPSHSFFRVAYTRSCSLDSRREVNRCDGFSAGRAIEIQEAKIAATLPWTNSGTKINAKQLNFLRITAIFDSVLSGRNYIFVHKFSHAKFVISFVISLQLFLLKRLLSNILPITFHCPKIGIS